VEWLVNLVYHFAIHFHFAKDCRIAILIEKIKQNEFSAFCTILVTFSLVTPEFTLVTIKPFAAIRQKSAYHAKYLRISWTYLDLLYMFGSRIGGYDYSNIRFAVAHVTSLWKPVKFGRCLQTSPGTTFTLAFYNGLTNREAAFNRLNHNNLANRTQIW